MEQSLIFIVEIRDNGYYKWYQIGKDFEQKDSWLYGVLQFCSCFMEFPGKVTSTVRPFSLISCYYENMLTNEHNASKYVSVGIIAMAIDILLFHMDFCFHTLTMSHNQQNCNRQLWKHIGKII